MLVNRAIISDTPLVHPRMLDLLIERKGLTSSLTNAEYRELAPKVKRSNLADALVMFWRTARHTPHCLTT